AKSGSLAGVVRNEVGVVEREGGGRYAVGVFSVQVEPGADEVEVNSALATVVRLGVAQLAQARSRAMIRPTDRPPNPALPHTAAGCSLQASSG
ncbi:MAG: hypothetical protein ACREN4_03230, partial [Candidatus Dormibacteria bacterium]